MYLVISLKLLIVYFAVGGLAISDRYFSMCQSSLKDFINIKRRPYALHQSS